VSMVFQSGALFDSITVGENVAFPLRERGDMEEDQITQIVKGLLEMVGVAGMDNLRPSDLSTGMKRSVAIARALAAQPEAVLYDEPTTMVDPLMGHLLGIETAASSDEHRGDARYAFCEAARGSDCLSASG
jgi:phospholipid/cholesterol/gamma-HCH transport system ATP-binding protein